MPGKKSSIDDFEEEISSVLQQQDDSEDVSWPEDNVPVVAPKNDWSLEDDDV